MAGKAYEFSEDILKQCVKKNYSKFASGLDPKGKILDTLYEKDVITIEERKHIENLPKRRGTALVDILYDCGGGGLMQ